MKGNSSVCVYVCVCVFRGWLVCASGWVVGCLYMSMYVYVCV